MTTATSQGEAHEVAKENKKAIQARNLRTGVLFTAPALIILAILSSTRPSRRSSRP